MEFSLLGLPFILLLLFLIQIGLYFVYKMALDSAVLHQAEQLSTTFSSNTAPTLLTPGASGTLAANMTTMAGGFITNVSALSAEVQPLVNISNAVTPISTSFLVNEGSANTVLAVRASYVVPILMPGISQVLTVYSSALVRRQNL